MRRVLIVGSGGAGKSTLARALGVRLGLPVVHLDRLYWRSGWEGTPLGEWIPAVERVLEGAAWVIDGNYGGTLERRLAAADTAVFLDLPRALCSWRIVRRRVRWSGRSRPDMAAGCPERLSWDFVRWVWRYPEARRPGVLAQLEAAEGVRVVRLRSRRDVRAFLASLPPPAGDGGARPPRSGGASGP